MKKIAILCLALVMALGSLGVAYAAWQETLTIDGTVDTGNVDVELTFVGTGDDEAAGKDYSSVAAEICPITGNLVVTITDAYPCITYYVDFGILSTGTVPVHFEEFVTDLADMPAGATVTIKEADGYLPIVDEQLHVGDTWLGRLEVHLTSEAAELATYTFTVTVLAHQWNLLP